MVSRSSKSAFPSNVKVAAGEYTPEFLKATFQGQEALVLAVGFHALAEQQFALIDAAAAAGVKYVLPTEYGSDLNHPAIKDLVPLYATKHAARERIQKHGMKSIAVISNPWLEYCIKGPNFFIDVKEKKATLFDEGKVVMTTSTMAQVGRAVAGLLSLPEDELASFGNKFVYFSSFALTQRQLLDAVIRVTGTNAAEWEISHGDAGELIEQGQIKLQKGDFSGMLNLISGPYFKENMGGDIRGQSTYLNKKLGLPEENLDVALKAALEE